MSRHATQTPPSPPRARTHPDADHALRHLCAQLFAEPARLAQTLTHQVKQRFTIAPHAHRDTLQLDLLVGCAGRAFAEGQWTALSGTTALVAYPGQAHGYELDPGQAPSRVYHLKLAIEPRWPIAALRPLPAALTGLGRLDPLVGALTVIMRLNLVRHVQPPLLYARLAEALCLWPTNASEDDEAGAPLSPLTELDLQRAVRLVDQRPSHPPTLEELAAAAGLSARHFARRFRAAYGCTPHTYITARRLDQARKLLLEHRMKIHEIAEALGFSSVATFSRWFSTHFGAAPSQFRDDPTVM